MKGEEPKALLIVVTRTHTHKGDNDDEFVTYWNGKRDDSGKLYSFNDACDFLLVHGYLGMQNEIQDSIEILLHKNKKEISEYNPVHIFVHAREKYRGKIFKDQGDIHKNVQEYGSGGVGLAPQDLLAKIEKLEDGTSRIDWKNQICIKIREELKGSRYKQHLLNHILVLLLRLRLNLEVFAGNSDETIRKEASEDIENVKEKFKDILDKPPLKPQLNKLYENMIVKERLISILVTGLNKNIQQEEYKLLQAAKIWTFVLSNELPVSPSEQLREKLPKISDDFELLSTSVETIMKRIKTSSWSGV